MKLVSLKIEAFQKLVNKLRECMEKNRRLNAEIEAYNSKYTDRKKP